MIPAPIGAPTAPDPAVSRADIVPSARFVASQPTLRNPDLLMEIRFSASSHCAVGEPADLGIAGSADGL